MTPAELTALLDRLVAGWENEVVEFKEAGDNFPTSDIGKYFSALSNEANLGGVDAGWLVFGVKNATREVVGTEFRRDPERLQGLKNQIADGSGSSLRGIHELAHPKGRVVLFEIPPAPPGLPTGWNGHFYAREGEHLRALSEAKRDAIRRQGRNDDWSAATVPQAGPDDLDPDAVALARRAFASRHAERHTVEQVESWPLDVFLARAQLTRSGQLTRAALLLLGKPEATHHLSPLLAEITWRLMGSDRAYEHYKPPFLTASTALFERLRNYQIRLLQPGTLLQVEIQKYERKSILEALHNCIAHADYRSGARIVVQEHDDRIVFINEGSFIEGKPDDYILEERQPRIYRNPALVEAMTQLNMIDHLGSGIPLIHRLQRARFLPMPDYDLDSEPNAVKLTIYGAVIDEHYTDLLMAGAALPLEDVLSLDCVQKGRAIPKETADRLRRQRLIEGRRPNYRVSGEIAALTGNLADYVRTRPQADTHYRTLLLDFLSRSGGASRQDIDVLLRPILSDALTAEQKTNKISNLLAQLRRDGAIRNAGSRKQPTWVRL